MVANKIDIEDRSIIRKEEGQKFAGQIDADFFEVSALKGTNVTLPFQHLAKAFYEKYQSKIQTLQSIVNSS